MLVIPECRPYSNTVASPKQLLGYLKAGCEIKQVGQNEQPLRTKPKYYLIAPNLQWEFELDSEHVKALETLELIAVDCSVASSEGCYWMSKADFAIPDIKTFPELSCECGWQGDSSQLKENGSLTHADTWYECPVCSGDVLSMKRLHGSVITPNHERAPLG